MRTHLTEEDLVDLAEGAGDTTSRAHLEACAECADRVSGLRETLALVDVPLPEPSPLFWQALPRRVDAAIEAGQRRRRRLAFLAPALLATAAVAAVAVVVPRPEPVGTTPGTLARPLPAWSALPDDDEELDVLGEIASAPSDLGLAACPDVARCLAALDEEEHTALAAALRDALGVKGDL